MKLDIKHLKKIHSDNHSTTLQHDRGHKIIIAHGGLSEDMRKQLGSIKMSEGGYIEDRDKLNDADTNYKPMQQQKPKQQPTEGTVVGPRKTYDQAMHDLSAKPYAKGGKVQSFQSGGMSMPDGEDDNNMELSGNQAMDMETQGSNNVEGGAPSQMSQAWQPAQEPQAPQMSEQPQSNIPNQAPMANTSGYEKALNQEAQAVGAQGKAEADAAQAHLDSMDKVVKDYEANSKSLLDERMKVMHDSLNDKIDPKHWWDSKSTGGKIATAVGLFLGGVGAGMSGGPNVVLDLVNKQIDRDIDAQRANMGQKNNMMTALTQQLGDVNSATSMAKILKLDQLQATFYKAAGLSKDPIAKARAQQAIQMIKMQSDSQQQQLAKQMAVRQGVTNGSISPAQAVPLLVPGPHQNKALEEIKNVGETNQAMSDVQNAMRDVQKLQTVGSRVLSPIQSKSKIDALNLQIGALGKEMFGRLNEQELKMLEQSHVKLSDSASTVDTKIKNLQQIMSKHQGSPTLDAFGIRLPKKNPNFTPRGQ